MATTNFSDSLSALVPDYANILATIPIWVIVLLVISMIWKFTWYALGLYNSGVKKQKAWFTVLFICMFFLNDLGLLPILYLVFNREKPLLKQAVKAKVKGKKKK